MTETATRPQHRTRRRARHRRHAKVVTLLLVLTLLAAACGGAAADSDGTAAGATDQNDEGSTDDGESMDDDGESMDDDTVTVTIENIAAFAIGDSGAFAVAAGADGPGPALPGDAYEFTVHANPGDRLSFATMFVQTNDWFFAPDPAGIELYDADGTPISGDVTDRVFTFDSGTEIDQPVGEGADQAPRQSGPDTGAVDPDDDVRRVERDASNYVGVLVTPGPDGRFDVRIENVSAMATVPSPLAPGVFAVHGPDVALFEVGTADAGNGLEALAEDGDPAPLADHLGGLTGTSTPLSPGVWAVHDDGVALYELGATDAGLGLEALAEDGDPADLADALSGLDGVTASAAFAVPDGADGPGPALPGDTYRFEVPLADGRLSFATMFVESNDWIIATPADGLDLTDLDGDISGSLLVVDVGTEIDQRPGSGPDQAPRQPGPDSGADDGDESVRIVEGRRAERYVRVTIER